MSYRRPNVAGKHSKGVAPRHFAGRFEGDVVSGGLWYQSCGAWNDHVHTKDGLGEESKPKYEAIPSEFDSVDEYIRVFDPLVVEEAKECVRSSWIEHCQGGHGMYAVITSVDDLKNQGDAAAQYRQIWSVVKLGVRKGSVSELTRLCPPNMVVVLSSKRPSTSMSGIHDWTCAGAECKDKEEGVLVAGVALRKGVGQQQGLWIKVHPICQRHMNAVFSKESDNQSKCHACISSFQRLKDSVQKEWWVTPTQMLVSSEREFDALHSVRSIDSSLMRYILKPSLLVSMNRVYMNDTVRRDMWPKHAQHKPFIQFLKSKYDYRQLEAIEMTACQLTSRNGGSSNTNLPFVLIQGPPGTGKTHTVLGVLNVWHLSAYQQYYSIMIQSVIERTKKTGSGLNSMSHALGLGAKKPRILVCTPSNAACDELMARVMKDGFCDGNGKAYKPNIVRIGGDAAVDPRVKDRFLNSLVSRYSSMSETDWQNSYLECVHKLQNVEREGRIMEASLSKTSSQSEINAAAHALVDISQSVDRVSKQIEKLQACKPLVSGAKDGSFGRQAISEVETLLLAEAEMVFSTLSSTQRKIFKDACSRAPFHTVLIDEAGQASEVATLQPLTAGAKSVVLVGDPQQLPATILSEAGKAVQMERSLFERLQRQGCPVALLSVQYRMHPEIRKFPSQHFYNGKLEDAKEVCDMPSEPYHSTNFLGPYQVFDVAEGQEKRGKNGGSLSNAAEADLAAGLYGRLMQELELQLASTTISVAVITPYREQKALLRKRFEELWGSKSLKNVAIETIDSYQGRQVDVVILSCVRAGSGGGLGFVNDVRRMNVAITRARRSLWILGALATLRANKEWKALIQDAEERKLVVSPACAEKMFPELDSLRQKKVPDKQPMSSARKSSNCVNLVPMRPLAARPMAPVVPMKKATKHQPISTSSRPMRKLQDAEKKEYGATSMHNSNEAKVVVSQKRKKRTRSEQSNSGTTYPSIPEGR
ncbi:hypothetical protein M9434_002429 [Picochlorum sp. BPE23]|nr:hypothetical protein M9434_002429 [Picochlorum sp. BPE23]